MADISEIIYFNLYDGTHHFYPSSKLQTIKMLINLLGKAQASLEAWQQYKDPYLSDEENKKELRLRKKAVNYLSAAIKRVENGPNDQSWSLTYYRCPSRVILRRVKNAW